MKLYEVLNESNDLWDNPTVDGVLEWFENNLNKTYGKKSVSISNGRVNCNFSVEIDGYSCGHISRLPFKFGSVKNFSVFDSVSSKEFLKTTDGFPTIVKGNLWISHINAEHITDFPKEIKGNNIVLKDSSLKSLKGLEHLGGKEKSLDVSMCKQLTSLEGAPKELQSLDAHHTNISDLSDIHKHFDYLERFCVSIPIKRGLLAILKIKGFADNFMPRISLYNWSNTPDKVVKAVDLIDNLAKSGIKGAKLLVAAHRALIENDLDELAEID